MVHIQKSKIHVLGQLNNNKLKMNYNKTNLT